MMNSLNWVRLNKRWENQLLVMLFKCLIHKAPPYLYSQFTYTQSIHSHGTRSQSSKCLLLPTWNIIPGKSSPSIGLTNLAKPYHVHYHLSQLIWLVRTGARRYAPPPQPRYSASRCWLMSVGTRLVLGKRSFHYRACHSWNTLSFHNELVLIQEANFCYII